jgi:hypothetical protein
VLAAALDLADAGIPVFPCRADKRPATANGFKDATLNPTAALFGDSPLIGVPTGEASGFDVLDIDPGKGGDAWLSFVAEQIPKTKAYRTRSGGRHILFRHHPGVRNSASRIAPGVDVRGDGGYVVWWPAAGCDVLSDVDPVEWPQTFLGKALKPAKLAAAADGENVATTFTADSADGALSSILTRVSNAEDGEKHTTLRDAAILLGGLLHALGLSFDQALDRLMDALPASAENLDLARDTAKWGLDQGCKRPMQLVTPPSAQDEFSVVPLAEMPAGGKPLVRIRVDNESQQIELAEEAVIAAERGLYQRGSEIVRVAPVATRTQGGATLDVQRLVTVNDVYLRSEFDGAAVWRKWDVRAKSYVPARCPLKVPPTYLARQGHGWRLPPLAGMIHAPTLRSDGTVITAPGYDAATGLLFDPIGTVFPPINDTPTRSDAESGLAELEGLIKHFPFVSDADRAAALSAMLTGVARASMATAPMHAFTATEPGTGKSKLATIAALIATGRSAPAANYTDSAEEVRKAVDAALLSGSPVFCLDNVDSELKGARLCTALTEDIVSVRILGQTKNVEMQSRVFFMATGNGMTVADDMTRRVVLCRLDAGVERPELRQFVFDPVERVRADRGRYVAAALTVLRAYHRADRPNPPKPLGSFEQWSSSVRGALVWLGRADPVETLNSARADDPRRNERRAVLHHWHAVLGGDRVTSSTIIHRASVVDEFREALLAVAGAGGHINTIRLGKWLTGNKGRIVDGLRIEHGGIVGGTNTWRVANGP